MRRFERPFLAAFLCATALASVLARPVLAEPSNDDDPYNAHDPMRGDIADDARDLDTNRDRCEGGNAKACRHLAGMYSDGRGVGVDEERSREYLRRGCVGGDEQSCRKLNR